MENDARRHHKSENERERQPLGSIRRELKKESGYGSNGQVGSLPPVGLAAASEGGLTVAARVRWGEALAAQFRWEVGPRNLRLRWAFFLARKETWQKVR